MRTIERNPLLPGASVAINLMRVRAYLRRTRPGYMIKPAYALRAEARNAQKQRRLPRQLAIMMAHNRTK